jgi:hypothetical protein
MGLDSMHSNNYAVTACKPLDSNFGGPILKMDG